MKMLTRSGNNEYLESLRERLEENGIPAVIHGTETARMIVPTLLFEPSLWVYLNDQFEDAKGLLDNPEHRVTTGIDVEAFYANQPSQEELNTQSLNLVSNAALFILFGLLALWLLFKITG